MHAIQPLHLATGHPSQAAPSEQCQQPKPFAITSKRQGSLIWLRYSLIAQCHSAALGQNEYSCCSTWHQVTERSATMIGAFLSEQFCFCSTYVPVGTQRCSGQASVPPSLHSCEVFGDS